MKRNLCRCLLTVGGLLLPCVIQVSQAQDALPQGQPGGPPGFFPGGPGGNPVNVPQGQPGFAPSQDLFQPMPVMMPEIAQKTLQIAILRELNELRMNEKEVEVTLNALKQIRDNDKALQTTVMQILDEEKKALLSARPDAPVQHNAGERMQQASEQLREKQDAVWRGLAQAIGGNRLNAIRDMLGQGGGNPFPGAFNGPNNQDPNFRPQGQPGQPGLFGPGGQRSPNGRPGNGRQPGNDPLGQPGQSPRPGQPGGQNGQPPLPGQPGGQNGGDPFFDSSGAGGQNAPGQFNPFGAPGQPPQPGQQNGQNRPFGQFGQPGQPGWRSGQFNAFGNGAGWRQRPHISLKEMIDLLQEKLSAMRK